MDAVARMWIMVAEVCGVLPFSGRVGEYQILGFTPGCSGSRAQRGSLQKPPFEALASRGCSRQGHCPPTGGSHLRPSGAEGTGSIQLEDTWAGVLGKHIPLLGEFGGGQGEGGQEPEHR